jgi:hypothetical protein
MRKIATEELQSKEQPFTLVVINAEGDGYYVIESRELGAVKRPLEPSCRQLVEKRIPTQHVAYPDAPPAHMARAMLEQELAATRPDCEGAAEFCGTFYLNLNAFR